MKANTPEKIYLYPSELAGIDYDEEWYSSPVGNSIEYTRTDAFIEKALAYLHNKFYFNNVFYGIVNTDFNAMEEMYKDFENYMTEE